MTAIPNNERMFDLLADRALVGLDASDAMELQRLLSDQSAVREDDFDLAAAALQLGLGVEEEPLPEAIRQRLETAAEELIAPAVTIRSVQPHAIRHEVIERPSVAGRIGWLPWVVAAASLAVASIAWLRTSGPVAWEAPISEQFAALRVASGTVSLEWAALDDPTAQGAGGEVIWNEAEQRGFMRFRGLAANDPAQQQYQLWIFDTTRPEATPVDGGVFDIQAEGEIIIPINAKLPVGEASAFAVTVEPPGGVVVSDRSRIALLAARG